MSISQIFSVCSQNRSWGSSGPGIRVRRSTVDVRHLVPASMLPQDRFWEHTRKSWLLDMGMLAALALFYTGFVRWKIRLRR